MENKLHIVQHLYGEGEDRIELSRVLEDEALREEYEALVATKALLDQRKRARPDPAVIDRIMVAAAVPASNTPPARMDRAARPGRISRRYRLIGSITAALAVVLVVAVGLDQYRDVTRSKASNEAFMAQPESPAPSRLDAGAVSEAEADEAPGEGLERSRELREEQPAPAFPVAEEPAAAPSDAAFAGRSIAALRTMADDEKKEAEEDSIPAWDDADELLRVHRRIEMLRARSLEGTWDESEVMSLDSMPPQQPAMGRLNVVGDQRTGDQR